MRTRLLALVLGVLIVLAMFYLDWVHAEKMREPYHAGSAETSAN